MAAKLKTVKITYEELENIVESRGNNKVSHPQKENTKINDNQSKHRKSKRPEIGIYRPPSLQKHRQSSDEPADNGRVQGGENWEDEVEGQNSTENSKENSIEREIDNASTSLKEININDKHDVSKSRRKRPEIQRYVPKGKILEMQQKENEETESSSEAEKNALFIDEDSIMSAKDDFRNIKVTVSKDGDSKQVSRSKSGDLIEQDQSHPASRSKSDSNVYNYQNRMRGQGFHDENGDSSDAQNNRNNQTKNSLNERFSQSPKPQRTNRRLGKIRDSKPDAYNITDEDASDNDNVIQTMVFERKNNQGSKLTAENLAQKPPRGGGSKPGSRRYSSNMRRQRAGSFSSDVSTSSDLSIDEETTERILVWDKEVEIEMAKQVHKETQKLKEYLEKQEEGIDWEKDHKSTDLGDWASQVASPDDPQDLPPSWDNIKPAGSHDMLDKISNKKDSIDQKNYQNAGTFPRRNKRNSGDRYQGQRPSDGQNTNYNAQSWDRRWNKDNRQDMEEYYRGYGRRERRMSDGSKGNRRRRQSRESGGRRSRDSSVSSVHSVRSNVGDEDMYGSYRRPRRQNSNSSMKGGSSRERLNDTDSLNIKVTVGGDKRQVEMPHNDNLPHGKNIGRGRGRGRRQHAGYDTKDGQNVGSRGNSEEPEGVKHKDEKNKGPAERDVKKNVGRGRGGRNRSREDWGRGDMHKDSVGHHQGNRQPEGGRGQRVRRESDEWRSEGGRGQRIRKESDEWRRDWNQGRSAEGHHHDNRYQDGGRGPRRRNNSDDWKRDRAFDKGQHPSDDRYGNRNQNSNDKGTEEKSPRTDKTHGGGLIKLPPNVHTNEHEEHKEEKSHIEKAHSPKPKEVVSSGRPSAGQKQLFDPKNPNKPIVVQGSSNLKFYDQGLESPSPPAHPHTPPFQGYGPFYGPPQFPDQAMYQGPPPPQMMPPHGFFYGGYPPPPGYLEMVRGKQREEMFNKMLNECLVLDSELGKLVARRLNGESLSLLDSKRQELLKKYEYLILWDIDQSTKNNVDQLLWKAVFYQVIEVFRKHTSEEEDAKPRLSQILDEGTAFYEQLIQKLQQTYRYKLDDFLDTNSLPPENVHRFVKLAILSTQRNMICLGDIARYREQMNDSGKINYGRARNWYTKAQTLAPKNGRPYNQLAILALYTRRKLDAVYYYMRSLAASNPFLTARESLMSLFDEARKKAEAAEKKRSEEKEKQKGTKQQHHKHGERIEIWISSDGTSSEDRGGRDDDDDLEKLDAVELNKRFVLSFLNIHGKLFTKIGRESFPECCAQMLKEFRALLKYNAIGPTRLLQLMAINMFAIDNTALKDTSLQSGFRSELQEQAVELGLYMFGILVERCSEQLKDHLQSPDYPTKLLNTEIEELIPGVKIWTDWMVCNSQYWNPPPSTLDPSLGVRIDVWSSTAHLCNILKDIDISHVKLYNERKEGCEPVLLMEDSMLSGFVPLLSAPIEISFVHNLVDKEIAQDCLRIQKLQLFGEYLCGIEPPMLSFSVENKEYFSIALSVEETEEQNKPSLSAEEWSDDEDVVIESEEEIIHDGDDEHVKELKVKKHKLKQMKQQQERQKENVQKIIDKNRHHCIELEIHPIILVPDTNCFIDHLSGLKKIVLSHKFTVTVPLIVINELDGLAKGSRDGQYSTPQHANKVRKTAEESVQFLEAEFEKKNSHLKTQTSKGNILETIAFRSEESENGTGNNDDVILSCCLHYCKDKAREFMPKEKDGPVRLYRDVVLLTDDRNLRLKAHTHNVPVKDVLSFIHWSKVT